MLNWNIVTKTQRNWNYDKPVSDEDAELIAERVRSTLTKQNIPYYDVYYTLNPKHIQAIKKISTRESRSQGQLHAPMLIWFAHNKLRAEQYIDEGKNIRGELNLITQRDKKEKYMYFSFGLAVAWTITAAVDMGYCTGASQCFDNDLVAKYLNDNTPYTFDDNNILSDVIIGIGHPLLDNHRIYIDSNNYRRQTPGFPNVKRKFKV